MARKRQKKTNDDDDEDDEVEDEEDEGFGTSAIQIIRKFVNDPTHPPLSKESLELDTVEEEEKFFETLKKSPFLVFDPIEDRIKLNTELASINVTNIKEKVDRFKIGVSQEDLIEFDASLADPIQDLLRNAAFLALKGWKDSNRHVVMLYPRTTDFLVPLSGTFTVSSNGRFLLTSVDLTKEVRRGDSLMIDGVPYRVSSEVNPLESMGKQQLQRLTGMEDHDLSLLAKRAHALLQSETSLPLNNPGQDWLEKLHAPYSSSSVAPPNEDPPNTRGASSYKFEFTSTKLPLDVPLARGVKVDKVYKQGMTNDVRSAYWHVANSKESNFLPGKTSELDKLLMKSGLLSESLLEGLNRNAVELTQAFEKRMMENKAPKRGGGWKKKKEG